MNTITFFSAKGAPGTTTAAMLVASLWPRPALLADCDPYGGDVGLRLPAPDGRPLDLLRGMLSLLPLARRSVTSEALLQHVQTTLGGGEVLVGLSSPDQAVAGGPVWATVAEAFAALPTHDVVIDVGRLDVRSPVLPLVLASQLAVCVVQGSVSGVYASRTRLRSLMPSLTAMDGSGPTVGILVHADEERDAASAAAVIQEEFPQVVYLGHLTSDRQGARIFDGLPVTRPERTLLVRSGAAAVTAMTSELDRRATRRQAPAPPLALQPQPAVSARPPVEDAAGDDADRPRTRSERRQAKTRRFGRRGSTEGSKA